MAYLHGTRNLDLAYARGHNWILLHPVMPTTPTRPTKDVRCRGRWLYPIPYPIQTSGLNLTRARANIHNRLRAPVGGVVGVAHYTTYGVGAAKPCHDRQLHQVVHTVQLENRILKKYTVKKMVKCKTSCTNLRGTIFNPTHFLERIAPRRDLTTIQAPGKVILGSRCLSHAFLGEKHQCSMLLSFFILRAGVRNTMLTYLWTRFVDCDIHVSLSLA